MFAHLATHRFLNLSNIVDGGTGIEESPMWNCYTAHLDAPVQVNIAHLEVLEYVCARKATSKKHVTNLFRHDLIEYLLVVGLLIDDSDPAHTEWRRRADVVAKAPWDEVSAVSVATSRWRNINLKEAESSGRSLRPSKLVSQNGPPPCIDYARNTFGEAISLEDTANSEIVKVLKLRRSSRNFDSESSLRLQEFSAIMRGAWGVTRTSEVAPGFTIAHKGVPSGGGLHPIEAYVLSSRIEGVPSGLHHYRAMRNELAPIKNLPKEKAASLAVQLLAGQEWAACAPLIIIMTARIDRQLWKYRRHPKALRVLYMDAGHLSQAVYLIATELRLGVVVSAAINDQDVEKELALDPMIEIPIAALAVGRTTNV